MSRHTAGPWTVTKELPDDLHKITVSPPFIRADIGLEIKVRSAHLIDVEEMKANANLIAAAPDLLEALELITMELIQMHNHYQPECEGGCPSVSYVEQAQAAIKKSRGE